MIAVVLTCPRKLPSTSACMCKQSTAKYNSSQEVTGFSVLFKRPKMVALNLQVSTGVLRPCKATQIQLDLGITYGIEMTTQRRYKTSTQGLRLCELRK